MASPPDPLIDSFIGGARGAAASRRLHTSDLRDFDRWCRADGISLTTCTPDHLSRYMRHLEGRQLASTTQVRYGLSLRKFYAWMTETGKVSHDPTLGVISKKFSRGRRTDVLPVDDLRAILATASENDADAVVVMLLGVNALSNQDIVALDVVDVSGDASNMTARLPHARGGRIDVPPVLAERLIRVIGDRRRGPLILTRRGNRAHRIQLARIVRRVALAAGISAHVSPAILTHSARHAAIAEGFSFLEIVHGMPQGRHENLVLRAREMPPPRRPASHRLAALFHHSPHSTEALLDQAEDLATQGVHPAVRVMLVGAVFEMHLRALVRHHLPQQRTPRNPENTGIGTWTTALRGSKLISNSDKRQADDIADGRTQAAHGYFDQIDVAIANELCEKARAFVAKHPVP